MNDSLGAIKLTEEHCLTFFGVYAFSGNEDVSSFFNRSNEKCQMVIQKFSKLLTSFKTLGTSQELHLDLFDQLK